MAPMQTFQITEPSKKRRTGTHKYNQNMLRAFSTMIQHVGASRQGLMNHGRLEAIGAALGCQVGASMIMGEETGNYRRCIGMSGNRC